MAEALGGLTLFMLAALWLFSAFATSTLFEEKRRSSLGGFLVGLIFGVFGLAVGIGLPMGGKPCRACMEKIHEHASICPHCGTGDPHRGKA